MIGGTFTTFLYLIGVLDQREGMMTPPFLFELTVQAVLFAISCSIGFFAGATIASRLFGATILSNQDDNEMTYEESPDT